MAQRLSTGEKRAAVIPLMKRAYRRGQTAESFFWDIRQKGLGYRHQTMQSDWRSESELEKKTDLLRFVRKDRMPSKANIAQVDYMYGKEYMYKLKVQSRLRPEEPLTERFVNIMSDVPMTPGMVEQAVVEKWAEWEDYTAEAIEKVTVWQASQTTMV